MQFFKNCFKYVHIIKLGNNRKGEKMFFTQ